jgi:hypothetical protein
MQNNSVAGPAPAGMMWRNILPGQSSNEALPGLAGTLRGISNASATATVARDTMPAERHRVAIGLRWAFLLRWTAMSPEADAVVDSLVHCMDAETMPLPEVLRLWDSAFGKLRPRDSVGATTLATAGAVRQMLGDAPGHVRIADEATQGIWIKAGVMAGALWPKRLEGRVGPSDDTLALANQAIVEILCSQSAEDLRQCAIGLKGFARDLLEPRMDGQSYSADTLAFSRGLEAAARVVRDHYNDAYYDALGGQLTHPDTFDGLGLPPLR